MSIHCGTSYGKIVHKVLTQDLPALLEGRAGQGRLPRGSSPEEGKGGEWGFRQRRKHEHRCRGLRKAQGIWGYMKFKYFQ